MLISGLVTDMVGSYGRTDLVEFQAYEKYYNDTQELNTEYIASQEGLNDSSLFPTERYEDSMFRKGIKTWRKTLSTTKYYIKVLGTTFDQIGLAGFDFPQPVKTTIIALLSITIVVLVVKAFWRFSDVWQRKIIEKTKLRK